MDIETKTAREDRPAEAVVDEELIAELEKALLEGALPGETAGLGGEALTDAAEFIAAVAARRPPGIALVRLESAGGTVGNRRMRLAVVNDDMPFLVDSVTNSIAARGLIVHRLLHPVVCVERDERGRLREIMELCETSDKARESIMYLELDRVDARARRELISDLHRVLADVRAAVKDWKKMQAAMRADAGRASDEEGAALLRWFVDHNFTLLGHQTERPGEAPEDVLGMLRIPGAPLWDESALATAIAYFEKGGRAPLLAKADRLSSVHRRVPLDILVLPLGEDGAVTGVSLHAGLWTSQALHMPPEDVPLLRERLARMQAEFDFDPRGHSGKALRHAVASLPSDLLVGLEYDAVRRLSLTAMSLADRPRPALMLLPDSLGRHLFAFVWLPRDELTTARRLRIGEMLQSSTEAGISSWSVELGDGDLALLRYTLDLDPGRELPDAGRLDAELLDMVRGWEPGVEEALGELVGPARATRLALGYLEDFPESYRARTPPVDAARDVLRLSRLGGPRARTVRIYRRDADPERQLRMKAYRRGGVIPLSDAVPVFENFGLRVLEEVPTELRGGELGHIHDFLFEIGAGTAEEVLDRSEMVEKAVAAVLQGKAENDPLNQLLVAVGLRPRDIVLYRALFRYLRQTGLSYSLSTVVEALRKAPTVARGLIRLFNLRHDPDFEGDRAEEESAVCKEIREGLGKVAAIDEDRILRLFQGVIMAMLRTNAFAPSAGEALAFKLESARLPDLPKPVPWREIWVYSPRVEGIHLRGGPIARGGIRWSDRRDDFRTEILGLMKAQLVKNAVIVPTGAKGGFYPKQLPPVGDRDAWIEEGRQSYCVFVRALLSITDNLVENEVVPPEGVHVRDSDDPYLVVAADKGTASFSDIANKIAIDHDFWLGDAFASGGSYGYDHKAMGITARGAWVSVQRHFRELGMDVQTDPVAVVGVGDMSGDVFGNGMLLSKTIRLLGAFDHRHIFLDPDPDPEQSWAERKRLFELPRSTWEDYDEKLISKGGGVFPRTQKSIDLSPEIRGALGVEEESLDPASLMRAILKAPVDLIWFGGIGTYVKAHDENQLDVGDPANDDVRIDGEMVRARAIGEGANLAITQAGRIEFAQRGGRVNTDFIDNSAGVDCSDNEVNIKIPLNRKMAEGRLGFEERNELLAAMTEEVAAIVLEDNRLQTLALSIAERGGARALPSYIRVIEILEEGGRLDRRVEGLEGNDELLRRMQEERGLTRPELAVLLSTSKMALQDAIEGGDLAEDPLLADDLCEAFPELLRKHHGEALLEHRLRREIIATKVANRFVNRLGVRAPLALTEEEGASLAQTATGFVAVENLFAMRALWRDLDALECSEDVRLELFQTAAEGMRLHIADLLRATMPETQPSEIVDMLKPGLDKLDEALEKLLREEPRAQSEALRDRLREIGAPQDVVERVARLFELNGALGIAALAQRIDCDEIALTEAYTRLGEALGLDWAQSAANRFVATDQWERLLTAGLARDFEQLRLDFLERKRSADPEAAVEKWVEAQGSRIKQFRRLVDRARTASATTAPMLAQIASQARVLLAR
ncbi:MAG: NAD-glutamate dehydrogenase [Sphingomonadaceae bacterium]